jgi:hypothetical protein
MKKVLYTFLAVSIIFAACKKEEDEVVTPVAPSIVGTWTPTSAAINYTVTMGEMMLMDTSYTMTPSNEDWEFTDVRFTADGQMIMDGDTMQYSYSGNVLTVTEDGETETNSCIVTSTSLTVVFSETEIYTEDYMGQEATITESSDITLNATRQ